MTFGSLFAGIGCIDSGLEDAGFTVEWQVENDRYARTVLEHHWPGLRRHADVRDFPPVPLDSWRVDLICGGDPCPSRSRARTIHGSTVPDLWPEFLRVVSTLRPLWVLREHVVADDTDRCGLDLAEAGYVPICLEMDGAEITGQSRPREYLCAVLESSGICPGQVFSESQGDRGDSSKIDKSTAMGSCITTNPMRFDSRDNYIVEPGRGTRILEADERERLQGLESGWTGVIPSFWQRARLTGNGAVKQKAEWIGRRIIECDMSRP